MITLARENGDRWARVLAIHMFYVHQSAERELIIIDPAFQSAALIHWHFEINGTADWSEAPLPLFPTPSVILRPILRHDVCQWARYLFFVALHLN